MKKLHIFDLARKSRDSYRKVYEDCQERREADLKEVQRDFKPGPRMREEKAKIEDRYASRLEAERSRIRMDFDDEITKTRAEIIGKVAHIPAESLKLLSALDHLTITQAEFDALCGSYGGKSPWFDKQLRSIAERNNLTVGDKLDPPVDIVLGVLDKLESGLHEYLDSHDDFTVTVDSGISDGTIFQLENAVYSAGTTPGFTPREAAERMVSRAASAGDTMAASTLIANAWNTADDQTRQEILATLSSGKYYIHSHALKLCGIDTILEDYQNNDGEHKAAADHCVEQLRQNPDNWYRAARFMQDAGGRDNPYLRNAIDSAFNNSPDLRRVMDALEVPGKTSDSVSEADSSNASDS